ncbi:MAG: hypothetical protein JOY90_01690 [Bradyrhizobium sp.]|uniref:hypothetical protein n=1 Tax=Bradyrhizobium sp. TaxID=376 RepID=UPI001DC7C28D|nr:hypothetical protein [Bradyrhizobium sp.]MBV9559166.1 hypothetical protein [Bradyrhizobium sp.]
MFEDLIPSASAQTSAPPPGLFDDLIPAGDAGGVAQAAKVAAPGGADEPALPRSTAGTDPGDDRIEAPTRKGQLAVALSGQTNAGDDTSAPPGLFDDLIPAGAIKGATINGLFGGPSPVELPSGFVAGITDIPREMAASTREAWENLRRTLPSSLGGDRDMASEGTLESLGRTGQGLLAAAALPFAPLQGAARSLMGHPMVAVDQALRREAVGLYGEDKVRDAELATGQTPGGMTYDEARRNADTALSLIAPRRGSPAGLESRQLPAPKEVGEVVQPPTEKIGEPGRPPPEEAETRRPPPDQAGAETTGPPPDQGQLSQNGAPSGAVSVSGRGEELPPRRKLPADRIKGYPEELGRGPIGDDGYALEGHHEGQVHGGVWVEITRTEHRLGKNFKRLHANTGQEKSKVEPNRRKREAYAFWSKDQREGRFDHLPRLPKSEKIQMQDAARVRLEEDDNNGGPR